MGEQICALPSISALKALLRSSNIDPTPPIWEIWTRCRSVSCAASRIDFTQTGGVGSKR